MSITRYEKQATGALEQVTRQLAWHGIAAKMRLIVGDPKEASTHLSLEIAERQADLLVAGALLVGKPA